MSNTAPRIALIHALELSVQPVRQSFEALWPEAVRLDLLDTSLSSDLAARGHLDQAMIDRFLTLGRYATDHAHADAILFTCSAFGPAIDAVKQDLSIPVLRPNEAAFAEALTIGDRLALVVTFPPSLPALRTELEEMAEASGRTIEITPVLVPDALAALNNGDGAAHDAAIVKACADLDDPDAVILGQFSLARAATALNARLTCPVLTTPDSAVLALKGQFSPD